MSTKIFYMLLLMFLLCALGYGSDPESLMLVRVDLKTREDHTRFGAMVKKYKIDVWKQLRHSATVAVEVNVKKEIAKHFPTKILREHLLRDIRYNTENNIKAKRRMKRKRLGTRSVAGYFASYVEILRWMKQLWWTHHFVDLVNIGESYEGRKMQVIQISSPFQATSKRSVLVFGGMHAREWLAVATVVNFIDKLVKGVQVQNSRILGLLEKFDFYILPVANPDGYEFTFREPITRLWRKTMRPVAEGCMGVDPNRNFDVEFLGGKETEYETKDPCSSTYRGEKPFSEACTTNIKRFVEKMENLTLFYDIHAYSQLYFVPYAFSKNVTPENDVEVRRVAKISKAAMEKVNNRKFELGSPAEILYPASGSTIDYMKKVAKVPYTYGMEVYPSYDSENGFLVKPKDIAPSGNEVSEAILAAAENIPD